MAMAPFNLSLLGATSSRSRRPTSYYNTFQTTCAVSSDTPPTYAAATRSQSWPAGFVKEGTEPLPKYSCTVGAEGKLLLNLESISPLRRSCEGEWREVYAVVRGTMINFHRVKDGGAGKMLRSYTLQHAEVGLAPDAQHSILVPQTRFAHLLPSAARKRAWQKDASLFKPVKQCILRLRSETDQVLLADSSEEFIYEFITVLSAAIDISHAIDERSIPRQCTVPRRRRRHRPQIQGDLADPALLAEQQRIFQQMYPSFAGAGPEIARPVSAEIQAPGPLTPPQEEEEVDFSMIREDSVPPARARTPVQSDEATRPSNIRQTTQITISSTFSDDMMYATPLTNFDHEGKWRPPHIRTIAQVQRYIRRCMPVLLADAPRASEIVISDGKRMRINSRMELLEEWELQPPAYKAHEFDTADGLARSYSQRSTTESGTQAGQLSSSSMLADDDQICPAETRLENLRLSKAISHSATEKHAVQPSNNELKTRNPEQRAREVHGFVFCF